MCTKNIVVALSLLIFAQQSFASSQEQYCGFTRKTVDQGALALGISQIPLMLISTAGIAFGIDEFYVALGLEILTGATCFVALKSRDCKNSKNYTDDIEIGLAIDNVTENSRSADSISEQQSPTGKKKRETSAQNIENIFVLSNSGPQKENSSSAEKIVKLNNDLEVNELVVDPDLYPTGINYGERLRSSSQQVLRYASDSFRNLLHNASGPVEIIDNQSSLVSTNSSEMDL